MKQKKTSLNHNFLFANCHLSCKKLAIIYKTFLSDFISKIPNCKDPK